MRKHHITKFICFLLILLTNSCTTVDFIKAYSSLGQGKSFNNKIFKKKGVSYKTGDLKQDWKLLNLEYGDLAFYNNEWNSTININSTCGSTKDYKLTMLSDSLLNGLQNKKLIERSIVIVNKEDALESKYLGEFEKNKVKMSIVVYTNNYCIYDFSYISDDIYFDEGYRDYKSFVSDFELIEDE